MSGIRPNGTGLRHHCPLLSALLVLRERRQALGLGLVSRVGTAMRRRPAREFSGDRTNWSGKPLAAVGSILEMCRY